MKIDPIIASNLKNGSIFLSDKYVFRIIFVLGSHCIYHIPFNIEIRQPFIR